MIDDLQIDCDECGQQDLPRFRKIGAIRLCLSCDEKIKKGIPIQEEPGKRQTPVSKIEPSPVCRIPSCERAANPRYCYVCTTCYTRLRKSKLWDKTLSPELLQQRLQSLPTKARSLGPVTCIWPGCTAPTWLCTIHRGRFNYAGLNPKMMPLEERQQWMEAWVPMPGKKRPVA